MIVKHIISKTKTDTKVHSTKLKIKQEEASVEKINEHDKPLNVMNKL